MCVVGLDACVICVCACSAIVNGVGGGGQDNLSGPRGLIANTEGNVLNVCECSGNIFGRSEVILSCFRTDESLYWSILVQLVVGNLSAVICHPSCSWHTDCSCHLIMSKYKALSDLCDASGTL